jgi:hypothetical protein
MRWQPGNGAAEALTEVFGSGMDGKTGNGHPEIDLRAGRLTPEAAITAFAQMRGEGSAAGR